MYGLIGDHIFFDNVNMDKNEDQSLYNHCMNYASMAWKGKRPAFNGDPTLIDRPWLASIDFRRDSLDSSSGSDLNAEDSSSESFLILPTTGKNNGIYHGIGTVAKIVSTKSGILWWIRKKNHYERLILSSCYIDFRKMTNVCLVENFDNSIKK